MKLSSILLLMMAPAFLFGRSEPLEVGDKAPQMASLTDTGETLELKTVYEAGPVLVYFYPRSDTPGCTKQACNLRDHFEALQDAGATVLGVSKDSVVRQAAFKKKYTLPFTLLADTEGKLGTAFGVQSGKTGSHRRQSFLVVDGKVAWRDLAATPATQAEDALAALQALRGSEADVSPSGD